MVRFKLACLIKLSGIKGINKIVSEETTEKFIANLTS
jgi:hypothetical protein